ncbi:MAG: hypothetical protein KDD44_06515, partial [Bdellovibrionales bacterium]|nr:hypothetical protein [Bdellovibrionales bacterium]
MQEVTASHVERLMPKARLVLAALFSAASLYFVIAMFAGSLRMPLLEGRRVVQDGLLTSLIVAGMLYVALRLVSRGAERAPGPFVFEVFALGLLLIAGSDFPARRFGFFPSESTVLDAGILGVAAAVWFLCARPSGRAAFIRGTLSWWMLLAVQLFVAVLFFRYVDGRLIFRDDHASFLYRFQLLREHFPYIPFYNTDWNAGYSAREFLPSGMLNVFLFFWPVLYFVGDIRQPDSLTLYNLIFPIVYIGIVPWSIFWASRAVGIGRQSASLAGMLALAPSFAYYEWLLRYGTLGFAFSAAVLPLTFAYAVRLVTLDRVPRWSDVLVLLVASFCCISWTVSGLLFLPLALLSLISFRHTFAAERRRKVITFLLLALILNGPWLAVFFRESKVLQFLGGDTLPGSQTKSVFAANANTDDASGSEPSFLGRAEEQGAEALRGFRREMVKVNPVLIVLLLPGVWTLGAGRLRRTIVVTMLWGCLLASVGDLIKPQVELRRLIIPLAFL